MAIKYGTIVNSSINEECCELRAEHNSKVPRLVKKWRGERPNPYRGDTVYSCFPLPNGK